MIHFVRSKLEFVIMLLLAFLLQSGNYFKIYLAYAANLPLEMMTVFFHESSHAIVALLTGGNSFNIELYFGAGGVCHCQSEYNFMVVAAGYLGQTLFGVLIYLGVTRWLKATVHHVAKICIITVLISMLLWIRDIQSFVALTMIAFFFAFIGNMKRYREMEICMKFIAIYLVLSGLIDPYYYYNYVASNRNLWDGAVVASLLNISEIKVVAFWCITSMLSLIFIWVAETHGYYEKIISQTVKDGKIER